MSMDPNFGPLIMFGAGGVHVEVLKDVVFRLCPVTDVDAREMIEELRSYPLLNGYRGSEPANLEFLSEMLQRVSILVSDLPQIVEMDLNPTKVFAERERCRILDARIRVSP
jgi:acyl-CoA synthetase (NDP forming)